MLKSKWSTYGSVILPLSLKVSTKYTMNNHGAVNFTYLHKLMSSSIVFYQFFLDLREKTSYKFSISSAG